MDNIKIKKVKRNKVLKYFQDSFDAAGIPADVTQNFDKSQSLMKDLVVQMTEFGLPGTYAIPSDMSEKDRNGKIEDYSKYLRNILSAARKATPEEMGFKYEFMKPLIDFPKLCTTVVERDILLSTKKYPRWNFWRSPEHGQIIRKENKLFFQGPFNQFDLSRAKDIHRSKMPRDKDLYWLELSIGHDTIYLAKFSIDKHQILDPHRLEHLLQESEPSVESA